MNGNGHAKGPAVLGTIEALAGLSPNEPPQDLPLVLESLLLVAEEPPTIAALATATATSKAEVSEGLDQLAAACVGRGIRVQRVEKGGRLSTAPESSSYVERFLGLERPNRLSKAALEVLAIIAYRQPVTKGVIESVRGVGCDGSLLTLRERNLVKAVGQAEGQGHAYLYGTTTRFLEHFGLERLDELPPLNGTNSRRPIEQGALSLSADQALTADGAADGTSNEPIEVSVGGDQDANAPA